MLTTRNAMWISICWLSQLQIHYVRIVQNSRSNFVLLPYCPGLIYIFYFFLEIWHQETIRYNIICGINVIYYVFRYIPTIDIRNLYCMFRCVLLLESSLFGLFEIGFGRCTVLESLDTWQVITERTLDHVEQDGLARRDGFWELWG